MNISLQMSFTNRCDHARELEANPWAALGELEAGHPEVMTPETDLAGVSADTMGDLVRGGDHGKVGGIQMGLGSLPGIDLLAGSILEDLAGQLGSDMLGQAEGMANGKEGSGSLTPGAQDVLDRKMGQNGFGSGGGEWKLRLGATGAVLGCAVGVAASRSLPGCAAAGTMGYKAGEFFGDILDSNMTAAPDGARGAGGSGGGAGGAGGAGDSSDSGSEQKSESSSNTEQRGCDALSQSCSGVTVQPPTSGGMGDDQDNDASTGDPVLATFLLQRRARAGDGAAAAVISAGMGGAQDLIPSWDVQPGSEDSNVGSGQVLGRVARHGDTFEGFAYHQQAGVIPPQAFIDALRAEASNPVVNPKAE